MDEEMTIQKNKALPSSQDYEFLRTEGLKHIESLSHDLWTDYNSHDPGITILEALCYAITELGYRSGFDMKDLLSDANHKIFANQNFFTAKKILTNNPLTINDYRKLLIDLDGIHNAFLFADDKTLDEKKNELPVNEIPIYANCKDDVLQYDPPTPEILFLNGLYHVLLDLDYSDQFGDLNTGDIVINNPKTTIFEQGEFTFSVELPAWKNADFIFAAQAKDPDNLATTTVSEESQHWIVELELTDTTAMLFSVFVSKNPSSKKVTTSDVKDMFDLTNTGIKDFVSEIFGLYLGKIEKARFIVQTAIKTLHEHRNLCEDYLEVTTVDDEEISFCFDVDVKPEADIEKVQAEMFYAIENYLNPSVDFYSLREMLDKKIPVDKIFEGPALNNGFVETEQLEATQLPSVVHTSDIINLLMDIEGVMAIRNFVMTKYSSDGNAVPGFTGLKWCMDITPFHKPVLSTDKSKVLLFKNQFPFLARYEEVRDTILLLHAQRSRAKLKGLNSDILLPEGNQRDTHSHWPVQYDFPLTYGIGEAGLPITASQERVAKQRQLKGYLMFFEQLLADFFSQLSNAHLLFSTDDIVQTYFAQFLKDIKDIEPVYNATGIFGKLEDVFAAQDSTQTMKNGWQDLYEPNDLFEERRNRFLDHLLARFAESFNDYAMLMYSINYDEQTEEKIDFAELTAAKIRTLKEYDVISSQRGKAFNYFPQNEDFTVDPAQLWDTENVSGIEKRISFLTGIKDYTRRFLYCIKNIEILCNEKEVLEVGNTILKCYHSYSVTTLSGLSMHSVVEYQTKEEALQAVLDVIELGADVMNYLFDPTDKTLQIIGHSNEVLLETEKTYPDKETAMADASEFAGEFSSDCNDPEGLHLIEHILLRPRDENFDLMQVCLHGCDCPCEIDPYSFQASVVLPYWPGHFDNSAFRQYFENKIREEAPAHIKLKICWLNNDLMREFEIRYKKWIETLADYSFDKSSKIDAFIDANNKMIEILSQLHSEYPQATLHNCFESEEGSNAVQLGKTVLGTFKN
jgi:hypothetical protein